MAFLTSGHYVIKLRNVKKNVSRSIIWVCTYVLMDPLVAVGRKSPQNSMWLPAIPVPCRTDTGPPLWTTKTNVNLYMESPSRPLARWGPVSHSPPEFCLSLLSENLWRCRRQQREEKRGEERTARASVVPLFSFPLCFFLFFPTPDLTPSLSSPPSGRPTKRAAVSI